MFTTKTVSNNVERLATMDAMSRNAYIADSLGDRIRRLRKERGWTQQALADKAGCSKRAISYYERDGRYPPAPILSAMANAFGITIEKLIDQDEPQTPIPSGQPNLLGDPEDRRLWRKFQQLKALPRRDQAAVFRMINRMTEAPN
jgi:transcriptional regulator with XRE-family HTH domain